MKNLFLKKIATGIQLFALVSFIVPNAQAASAEQAPIKGQAQADAIGNLFFNCLGTALGTLGTALVGATDTIPLLGVQVYESSRYAGEPASHFYTEALTGGVGPVVADLIVQGTQLIIYQKDKSGFAFTKDAYQPTREAASQLHAAMKSCEQSFPDLVRAFEKKSNSAQITGSGPNQFAGSSKPDNSSVPSDSKAPTKEAHPAS